MCYPVASAVVKTSTVAFTVGQTVLGIIIRAGPLIIVNKFQIASGVQENCEFVCSVVAEHG
jgi:hypothetical protein